MKIHITFGGLKKMVPKGAALLGGGALLEEVCLCGVGFSQVFQSVIVDLLMSLSQNV